MLYGLDFDVLLSHKGCLCADGVMLRTHCTGTYISTTMRQTALMLPHTHMPVLCQSLAFRAYPPGSSTSMSPIPGTGIGTPPCHTSGKNLASISSYLTLPHTLLLDSTQPDLRCPIFPQTGTGLPPWGSGCMSGKDLDADLAKQDPTVGSQFANNKLGQA